MSASTRPSDYARVRPKSAVVYVYHATVEILTGNDDGSQTVEYVECEHPHRTPEAAEACGRKTARQRNRRVI